MKNKLLKSLGLAILVLPLSNCTVVPQNTAIMSQVSVAEEGGIRFIQVTEESENVFGPSVASYSTAITWSTNQFLCVSADGNNLSYIGDGGAGAKNTNIFIRDTKGGKSTTQRTFKNGVLSPNYSPDGKHLIFSDYSEGDYNIYQINAKEGSAVQQITASVANETQPVFSKNGKEIFFVKESGDSKTFNIWTFNRESSVMTQFSEGFNPCPIDDKRILVTRNNKSSKRGEIWLLDLTTGSETMIVSDGKIGFSNPRISPDGKRLILVGATPATKNSRSNLNLYIINMDGTKLTQLTFHPAHDCSPEWALDGKSVYFISGRGNKTQKYQIWNMSIDTNN